MKEIVQKCFVSGSWVPATLTSQRPLDIERPADYIISQ